MKISVCQMLLLQGTHVILWQKASLLWRLCCLRTWWLQNLNTLATVAKWHVVVASSVYSWILELWAWKGPHAFLQPDLLLLWAIVYDFRAQNLGWSWAMVVEGHLVLLVSLPVQFISITSQISLWCLEWAWQKDWVIWFRAQNVLFFKKIFRDFPGGTVVKNPPASARGMGSVPGLGRSHMPPSN